jgi:hypothetical protein
MGWDHVLQTKSVRVVLATPGLSLAVAAGAVTALAAPADAAWHAAFGRDSVLWSPPHLLSVVGTATLLVATLIGVGAEHRALRIGLATSLLGAAEVVVLEYDTNVPQFAEALYVPLLVITGLGAAWVARSVVGDRFTVTWMVRCYTCSEWPCWWRWRCLGGLRPTFHSPCWDLWFWTRRPDWVRCDGRWRERPSSACRSSRLSLGSAASNSDRL